MPGRMIPARFSLVAVVLALYLMPGCTAAIRQEEKMADLKAQLEVVAQHYDAYRQEIKALRKMELIDDATWILLMEIDMFFNDQYSEALIRIETGADWRRQLGLIAEVVSFALPIVSAHNPAIAHDLGVVAKIADIIADGKKPGAFRKNK